MKMKLSSPSVWIVGRKGCTIMGCGMSGAGSPEVSRYWPLAPAPT